MSYCNKAKLILMHPALFRIGRSFPELGLLTSLAVTLLCHAGAADAQLVDRYLPPNVPGYATETGATVLSRGRPEYGYAGTQIGAFIVKPVINESLGYDSNLFGFSNPVGSPLIDSAGSLQINSDWSRDSLGADFSYDNLRYPNQPVENQNDFTASLGGSYDIGEDQVTLAASHLALHQDITQIGTLGLTVPIPYTVNDLRANYVTTLGRIALKPVIDISSYRFPGTLPGGNPGQTYRDRDLYDFSIGGYYPLAPLENIIVVLRHTTANYLHPGIGLPGEDSGESILVGMDYSVPGLWRYRALVGLETRSYSGGRTRSHRSPIFEGIAIWTPSGLTTVTASVERTIEDDAAGGTAGFVYTRARLIVDHEYLRNILLQGRLSVQHAAYLPHNGTETIGNAGASITWLLNRHMRVILGYHLAIVSLPGSRGFTDNRMVVQVQYGF
jgi:hypothetical protein